MARAFTPLHVSASPCSTFHHLTARLSSQSVANMSIITRSCSTSICEQTTCVTKAEQGTRHKDRFFVTSTPAAQTRRLPRLLFRPYSILSLDWAPKNRLLPCMHDGKMHWASINMNCECALTHDSASLFAVCRLRLGLILEGNAQ